LNSNVKIIIRSAGERTETICRNLVIDQGIPASQVTIVREVPFSAAMRKSFQIGIESRLPWTFCIDADVLLRPGSIETMLAFAETQDPNVCEIQGVVLCKFFGGPRPAGNHLYRTELLEQVIQCIPEEGVNIRPEFHTLNSMQSKGYPWLTVPYLVGLHDFEQFHLDIYRKCFVQAHKHDYLTELFTTFWRSCMRTDEDYRVAMAGFAGGLQHDGQVTIDVSSRLFDVQLAPLGFQEKAPLDKDAWTPSTIESIISGWKEPDIYLKLFPNRHGLDVAQQRQLGKWKKWKNLCSENGPFRAFIFVVGAMLARAAEKLKILGS